MSAVRDEHGRFTRDGRALLGKILARLARDKCTIDLVNDGKIATIAYTLPEGGRGGYKILVQRVARSKKTIRCTRAVA